MAVSSGFRLLFAILAIIVLASVHFDAVTAASSRKWAPPEAAVPTPARSPAPEPVQADKERPVERMKAMFSDSTPAPTPTPAPAPASALTQPQDQETSVVEGKRVAKSQLMFGDSIMKLVQSEAQAPTPAPTPIPAQSQDHVAKKPWYMSHDSVMKLLQLQAQVQTPTPAPAPAPAPAPQSEQAHHQGVKNPWFMFGDSNMKLVQSESLTQVQTPSPSPSPSPTSIPAQAQAQVASKPWLMFGDSTMKLVQSQTQPPAPTPIPTQTHAQTQDQQGKKPWFTFGHSTMKLVQSEAQTPAPSPSPIPTEAQDQPTKKPWFMFGHSTSKPTLSSAATPSLASQPAPVPAQAQSPKERMAEQKKHAIPRFKLGDITSASTPSLAPQPAPVPALVPLFIFGDSTLDVGTNNFVQNCSAIANFLYNGIDFPYGPTGRFSNGFNTADEIAKQLGYEMSPAPYLSLVQSEDCPQLNQLGANFASGGSGILNSTGEQQFGKVIWLGEQVQQFSKLRACMIKAAAGDVGSVNEKISKALFLIGVGSNDIFEFPVGSDLSAYLFNMGETYQEQLKKLYKLGARKFGVLSIPPIGCCPVARNRTGDGSCFDPANVVAQQFNSQVKELLETFSQDTHVKYSMANMFNATLDLIHNPKIPGKEFVNVESACCGDANFPCNQTASLCNNRQGFVFWDRFHPTQAISELAASVAFQGSSKYVNPINFAQLLAG